MEQNTCLFENIYKLGVQQEHKFKVQSMTTISWCIDILTVRYPYAGLNPEVNLPGEMSTETENC